MAIPPQTGREAQRAAEKAAQLTDGVTNAFDRELLAVYRNLERQLADLVQDMADLTRTQVIRTTRVLDLRARLREILTNAGLDALLIEATDLPLDALAAASLQTALGQDVVGMLSKLEPRIAALKALTLTDLLDQPEAVAHQLWKGVTQGVFSAREPKAILQDLRETLDDTVPHIETLYDTSVSIYSRQVSSLLTDPEDADALFLYNGPVDAVVRPFCREHVGKVYSRAEIDDLDNGQLPNTFLTGGGYNCRHSWTPLSRFSELRDLHGSDARMPEIAEELEAVKGVYKPSSRVGA